MPEQAKASKTEIKILLMYEVRYWCGLLILSLYFSFISSFCYLMLQPHNFLVLTLDVPCANRPIFNEGNFLKMFI